MDMEVEGLGGTLQYNEWTEYQLLIFNLKFLIIYVTKCGHDLSRPRQKVVLAYKVHNHNVA